MNRQQRRYAERKNQKYKTATYNPTKSQLDSTVKDSVKSELERAYQDGVNEGVSQAILILTLPLEVLMDFYRNLRLRRIERRPLEMRKCGKADICNVKMMF